jgi:HlyD family secretion protein
MFQNVSVRNSAETPLHCLNPILLDRARLSLETQFGSSMSRLVKLSLVFCLIASIIVLGWGFVYYNGLVPVARQSEKAVPPEPVLPSRVVALGVLEPRDGVIDVAGPTGSTGARVAKLLVVEGDAVVKGQLLAELDTRPGLLATVQQLEDEVATKKLLLQKSRLSVRKTTETTIANVDQLRAERDRSEVEYKKFSDLVKGGLYKKTVLKDKELALKAAEEKLKAAEIEAQFAREQSESGSEFDVANAELDLKANQSRLLKAKSDVEQASIFAPSDGIVLSVDAQAGEQIGDGRLLQLADISKMEVRVEVFETDALRINVGAAAEVRSHVLTTPLNGIVRWIGNSVGKQTVLADDPAANTDNRVITVKVSLDKASLGAAARLIGHQVRVTFAEARVAALETP